jgi:hypothetical protein
MRIFLFKVQLRIYIYESINAPNTFNGIDQVLNVAHSTQ